MTSQYRRGADFERACMKALLAQGAVYVCRSAGSHGPVDLIAFYEPLHTRAKERGWGLYHFVQAKRSGRISRADKWALVELAAQCGAVPVLAKAGPRGTPVLFETLERVVA